MIEWADVVDQVNWGGQSNARILEKTISKYQDDVEKLKGRMAEITNRYRPWELPKEYYDVQREMNTKRNALNKALDEMASRTKRKTSQERRTFVNGFGEATRREITSGTYERAQKRLQKEIDRRFEKR